jgi:hypothetical protein
MPVEDVITVSVPVTDQGRALAFYVGTLRLKLARVDETMPGIRRVQVTAGGTTCLSLVTWYESMPPAACAAWSCGPATWPPTTSGWRPRGGVRRAALHRAGRHRPGRLLGP